MVVNKFWEIEETHLTVRVHPLPKVIKNMISGDVGKVSDWQVQTGGNKKRVGEREKGRKGEREKGRKGEREKGRKGEREKGRRDNWQPALKAPDPIILDK